MKAPSIADLIDELEREVNNGGFDQFFFNSAGDFTQETIAALECINAHHTANLLKQAAMRFPKGMPSSNRFERQEELESISEGFGDLDNAFYEYKDDISGLLKQYQSTVSKT
ncbi:DMP19 family protein [Grimontia sp. AD028]|uniref:DMP19 family protein n=1 Tax=Grimontia sp. AD028 TaxID=1581149 RepID=UPI000698A02F|nr:DMP19 family protein [Grimontia sp. AD028]